ncbi:MAG: DNRLRE domain-containing protein [Bacteroidetes bacterium]|jgi:hypothetical protein|nr:DNRLRE domain-containing protein [Bacteroidota bacterium]
MRLITLALFITAVFCLPAIAQQQVVLTASRDNTLLETADGSTSNGIGANFFVGRVAGTGGGKIRRGLVKFDISPTVPSGAIITSVALTLNMSKTTSGTQTVVLRKVTADWGEGSSDAAGNEGGGAASVAGDATWIHRFKGTSNWTTAGGDLAAGVSASLAVGGVQSYTWSSTPELVADVQGWLANPSTNFGWIVIGGEAGPGTAKRFDSRENAIVANRPKLTISYTTSTSVADQPSVPEHIVLEFNYPNPFNPSTQIAYSLPADQTARLSVYNLLGVKVATLVDRPMTAGRHTVTWDATGMPSGLYLARLEAGGAIDMKRMVLAK